MLRANAGRGAVRAAKYNRAAHLSAGHIERLGGRVDYMVDGLHGEVKGHKLDNRAKAPHGRADANAGKSVLGNRRINHAALTKFFEQFAGNFIRALIDGDFLAHDKDFIITAHFFSHSVAQSVAHRCRHHFDIGGDVGF